MAHNSIADDDGGTEQADEPEAQGQDGFVPLAGIHPLVNEPQLLLADEPTGNLDPKTSEKVFMALLNMVRETGLSALIATHNPDLAAQMDRRVSLQNGVLVEEA